MFKVTFNNLDEEKMKFLMRLTAEFQKSSPEIERVIDIYYVNILENKEYIIGPDDIENRADDDECEKGVIRV